MRLPTILVGLAILAAPVEGQRRHYDRFADSTYWQAGGHQVSNAGASFASALGLGEAGDVSWEIRGFGWAAGNVQRPETVTLQATRGMMASRTAVRDQPGLTEAPETVELALIIDDTLRVRLTSRPRLAERRSTSVSSGGTLVADVYHFDLDEAIITAVRSVRRIEGRIGRVEFEWWSTDRSLREFRAVLAMLGGQG